MVLNSDDVLNDYGNHMSMVSNANDTKCQWYQMPIVPYAKGTNCLCYKLSMISNANVTKCQWYQMPMALNVNGS